MIIGFLGKKGSGKDTIAKMLIDNDDYIKYAFADPLKNSLKELFGFDDEQLDGDKKEAIDNNWNVTPREVMQFFGTEIMQYKIQELIPDCKRNFFVKRFENFIKKSTNKNIIVTDVRFQHEVDSILKNSGIVIKINRINNNNNFIEHQSEKDIENIINFSYEINNNDTQDMAYKKIISFISL